MKKNKITNDTFLRAAEKTDEYIHKERPHGTTEHHPFHSCIIIQNVLGWVKNDPAELMFYMELMNLSGDEYTSNYTFEAMEAKATKKAIKKLNVNKINERRVLALLFAHWAFNSEDS